MHDDGSFLRRAVTLAVESARSGCGPFGAVVAREASVLAEGANRVTVDRDPTAHAEMVALRAAARSLGTHTLRGAVLYCSSEPCPMCLGAAWWGRVDRIVFAATRADAAAAGFDDDALYAEVAAPLNRRSLPVTRRSDVDGARPFRAWAANPDRVPY